MDNLICFEVIIGNKHINRLITPSGCEEEWGGKDEVRRSSGSSWQCIQIEECHVILVCTRLHHQHQQQPTQSLLSLIDTYYLPLVFTEPSRTWGRASVYPQSASPSPLMLTRAIRTATTKYRRRLVRPPPTKREYQDFIFEVQPPINICTQRDLLLCCIHRASSLLIWELLL